MIKVIITIDEMKPHWAKEQGLDNEANSIGMKEVKITGDHDLKRTYIIGEIENEAEFKSKFESNILSYQGSWSLVS